MFYEVRVYNTKGKVKKVLSRDQLSKRHWEAFEKGKNIKKALKSLMRKMDPCIELGG